MPTDAQNRRGNSQIARSPLAPAPLIPLLLLALLLTSLLLAACAKESQPEAAVPPYLKALLGDDVAQLYKTVCPEWEPDAKRDFDAFSGVTGTLQDVQCTKTGADGDDALVTCTGTLHLNYNGELRDRSLEGQTYRVKKVDGDWKMCGYE